MSASIPLRSKNPPSAAAQITLEATPVDGYEMRIGTRGASPAVGTATGAAGVSAAGDAGLPAQAVVNKMAASVAPLTRLLSRHAMANRGVIRGADGAPAGPNSSPMVTPRPTI